jgi:hypothetical protein
MNLGEILNNILQSLPSFYWGNLVMIMVGILLIYLAIVKEYEPVLLLPIGFGCILANLGMAATASGDNFLSVLYRAGIQTELFPLLIFVGVGGMIDFSPLLAQPKMVLMGAAGQFGIYGTLILATLLKFNINQAASIGVIGAIDSRPACTHCRGSLLLYEPDPDHPTAHHETAHLPQGTTDPHGILTPASIQDCPDYLPDCSNHYCQPAGAPGCSLDRCIDAGQFS